MSDNGVKKNCAQRHVIDTLTQLIAECEQQQVTVDTSFEAEVARLRKARQRHLPWVTISRAKRSPV